MVAWHWLSPRTTQATTIAAPYSVYSPTVRRGAHRYLCTLFPPSQNLPCLSVALLYPPSPSLLRLIYEHPVSSPSLRAPSPFLECIPSLCPISSWSLSQSSLSPDPRPAWAPDPNFSLTMEYLYLRIPSPLLHPLLNELAMALPSCPWMTVPPTLRGLKVTSYPTSSFFGLHLPCCPNTPDHISKRVLSNLGLFPTSDVLVTEKCYRLCSQDLV